MESVQEGESKSSKGKGGDNTTIGKIDLHYGTVVYGNLHPCIKGHYPDKVF
jgi:hypothetical protein